MTWDTTYTAVANSIMTAAQWNQNVRDNLLATEAALAPTGFGYRFVSTGANAIAYRSTLTETIFNAESTTSRTYTDLGFVGPVVTLTTGTSAIAVWTVEIQNDTLDAESGVSVAVTGVPASTDWGSFLDGFPANSPTRVSGVHMFKELTPGTNDFTMKYLAGSGMATFANRTLLVIAF